MNRIIATALCGGLAGLGALPVTAEGLPSGLNVALYDLLIEAENSTARFRFVAPDLATMTHPAIEGDFPWLCEAVALPELDANGWTAQNVIISIGDREVAFGDTDPDAIQYFEAFSVVDGVCVLEVFYDPED